MRQDGNDYMNDGTPSFFNIRPTPATGRRYEIEWATVREDGGEELVSQLSFYYFALPGKLQTSILDI